MLMVLTLRLYDLRLIVILLYVLLQKPATA